jgi:hypothetical protein
MSPERPGQGEARDTRYTFQVTDRDLFHIIGLHVSQSSSNNHISHKSIPFLTIIAERKNLDDIRGLLLCEAMSMPNGDGKREKAIQPLMGDGKSLTMQDGRVWDKLWPQFDRVHVNWLEDFAIALGSSCLVGRDTATASI